MEIFDVPQLADMLRTAEPTVRTYLATGRIVGRKIGGKWLVCDEALRPFLMSPESTHHTTVNDNQAITTGG